jgi:hypothetical protein
VNIATLASVSDEALALFLLENSWDTWMDEYKIKMDKTNEEDSESADGDKEKKKKPRQAKYSSRRIKGEPVLVGGWTKVGGKRYVELFKLVGEAREKKEVDAFEEMYMLEKKMDRDDCRSSRERKRRRDEEAANAAGRAPPSPRIELCGG